MIDLTILIPLIGIGVLTIIFGFIAMKRDMQRNRTELTKTTLLKKYVLVTSFFTTTMITIFVLPFDLNFIIYVMIWMFGFVIPYFGFCNAVNKILKE